MSSFYSGMALTASRLISKYGYPALLTAHNDAVDPVTGVATTTSSNPVQVMGILQKYPTKLIDGSRIKTGDRLLIMDGNVKPLISDRVTIYSEDWAIESIETVNPASKTIVYFLQVRR